MMKMIQLKARGFSGQQSMHLASTVHRLCILRIMHDLTHPMKASTLMFFRQRTPRQCLPLPQRTVGCTYSLSRAKLCGKLPCMHALEHTEIEF